MMKRLLFIALTAFSGFGYAQQQLDQIAIIVDTEVITQKEWQSAMRQARAEVGTMPSSIRPTDERLKEEVFLMLAAEKLQHKYAKEVGMSVSDAQVDAAIKDIADRNGATVADLKAYMAYMGMNFNAYREDIRRQMLSAMLRNEVVRDVKINEAELDVYMNSKEFKDIQRELLKDNTAQYKVKHILIKISPSLSDEQARIQINRLRERIAGGESFDDLASAQSHDPISAARKGELGWVTRGQLAPEFERTMVRLKKGELSQPVKTVFGYHLILLEDQKNGVVDEEMMRNIAREYYFKKKAMQTFTLWVEERVADVYIERRI